MRQILVGQLRGSPSTLSAVVSPLVESLKSTQPMNEPTEIKRFSACLCFRCLCWVGANSVTYQSKLFHPKCLDKYLKQQIDKISARTDKVIAEPLPPDEPEQN